MMANLFVIFEILLLSPCLVFGQKANSCSDVIVGYNNTRVQYSLNPDNGEIGIVYGYNLFYPNGSWTDVDSQYDVVKGTYYLNTSRESESICYLHLVKDIQQNTSWVCITFTPTQVSSNILGANGCYNFGPCIQSCDDSNGNLKKPWNLFSYWNTKKIV